MTYLETGKHNFEHIRCINECEAIAIVSGYHLATGKIGVVYLQNSGLGKTVNPITSLAHQKVYNIPILLMIGWRGEPGKKDAYQHEKMGQITLELLQLLDIPYGFLSMDEDANRKLLLGATNELEKGQKSFAIIVKKGIFEDLPPPQQAITDTSSRSETTTLTREDAIKTIVEATADEYIIVSTTGKTSRELYETREALHQSHKNDFYNIGAMGCAKSIACAIALQKPNKRVIILDGDAAVLMQMGALATIGYYSPKNLYHIILDNSAHDSTGGQMTVSNKIEFNKISDGCGYNGYFEALDKNDLTSKLKPFLELTGPVLFRVRVHKGSREDLGRPSEKPEYYKSLFMKNIITK